MRRQLERYFEFEALGTDWRREIVAGFTTFVTMAYIIFVNPSILADAGMKPGAVMAATCLSAAVASILMGAVARYPIALAPGMGLNAYFTYSVVKGMGVEWETALGAVFVSGAIFFVLTLAGVRERLFAAIPAELYDAVAAGIGLFIAFIGLKNAGIIVAHPATTVALGKLSDPGTLLALFGLVLMATLLARGFPAAMLVGILGTALAGSLLGVGQVAMAPVALGDLWLTAGKLDIGAALRLGVLEVVFVFLFVDLFDNFGTLVAVGRKARLFDSANRIPRVRRILLTDATASMAGAALGTSTVVSYIESAAGIVAGGRSGVTAIVTGVLFALALVVAPLVGGIPAAATAPALILVGAAMLPHAAGIEWSDPGVAIPSFLTLLAIPLTFSIANGVALGFTAWTLLKLTTGRAREVSWVVWLLTVLFVARFVWLGAG